MNQFLVFILFSQTVGLPDIIKIGKATRLLNKTYIP
jgi:hypothetical protein